MMLEDFKFVSLPCEQRFLGCPVSPSIHEAAKGEKYDTLRFSRLLHPHSVFRLESSPPRYEIKQQTRELSQL